MLLFFTIVAALHLLGALILLVAWLRAPEGYEDDNGFHYGEEGEPVSQIPSYVHQEPVEAEQRDPGFGMAHAIRGSR